MRTARKQLKFRARRRDLQVICNVYEDGRWDRYIPSTSAPSATPRPAGTATPTTEQSPVVGNNGAIERSPARRPMTTVWRPTSPPRPVSCSPISAGSQLQGGIAHYELKDAGDEAAHTV
ncbi:MAG: hypothetical protein R2710_05245 [Acidimicrobiales bacterium]